VPGKDGTDTPSPARDGTLSENLIWFESHASLFQKGQELIFVCAFGMVLWLMLDVFPHDWRMRSTDAECSIALLPSESNPMLAYPA